MTKEEVRKSVDKFLEETEKSIADSTFRTLKNRINNFVSHYNDEFDMHTNAEMNLSKCKSLNSFKLRKNVYTRWMNFSGINCDISDITFNFPYITFQELQDKINAVDIKGVRDEDRYSRYYWVVAKLFAYLLWIGVSPKQAIKLTKGDYDRFNGVLYAGDTDFNLKSINYSDCRSVVCKELVKNIYSDIVKKDSVNVYKQVSAYEEYECLLRTIKHDSMDDNFLSRLYCVVNAQVGSVTIIQKSGLFDRLVKVYRRVSSLRVDKTDFKKVLQLKEIHSPFIYSERLYLEFKGYYEKLFPNN